MIYDTYVGNNWRRHEVRDDRFFDLVKSLAVATADRCQEGILSEEAYGKQVVAMAGCVFAEFLYVTGERKRPMSPEEVRTEIERLSKGVDKK